MRTFIFLILISVFSSCIEDPVGSLLEGDKIHINNVFPAKDGIYIATDNDKREMFSDRHLYFIKEHKVKSCKIDGSIIGVDNEKMIFTSLSNSREEISKILTQFTDLELKIIELRGLRRKNLDERKIVNYSLKESSNLKVQFYLLKQDLLKDTIIPVSNISFGHDRILVYSKIKGGIEYYEEYSLLNAQIAALEILIGVGKEKGYEMFD